MDKFVVKRPKVDPATDGAENSILTACRPIGLRFESSQAALESNDMNF
jgi:hypothetical protein